MDHRDHFTSGLEMERSEQITRKEAMRESADRISQNKRVSWGIVDVLTPYRRSLSELFGLV